MRKHHQSIASLLTIAMLFCVLLFGGGPRVVTLAQESPIITSPERERGIQLYKQGDTKEAIEALRAAVKQRKDDAEAWYYLGLALYRDEDLKGARKAYDKVVNLRPDHVDARTGLAYTKLLTNKLADAMREAEFALTLNARKAGAHYILSVVNFKQGHYPKALDEIEAALNIESDFPPALRLKSQVLFKLYMEDLASSTEESRAANLSRLKEATNSLKKSLELTPDAPNLDVWREQLETLRFYTELADKSGLDSEQMVFTGQEVTTKARIVSKPEPQYTEAARQNEVSGTVRLRAVFAADGKIKHIVVLDGLPYGLTEKCIEVARQ